MPGKNPSLNHNSLSSIESYNFHLPPELIAQEPAERRDKSRLLVYNRKNDSISHDRFYKLFNYLPEKVLMIFNDTKVIPARMQGIKLRTGKICDLLFYRKLPGNRYYVLAKKLRSYRDMDEILIGENPSMILRVKNDNTRLIVSYDDEKLLWEILSRYGKPPLPPYIRRETGQDSGDDRIRYQTLYARNEGSVAAPTAGLHFSDIMLKYIQNSPDIKTAFVTLDISLATFKPVRVENIHQHSMEGEKVSLNSENAEMILEAKASGIPIVAVGTTTLKSIEGIYSREGEIKPFSGEIDLFIRPPFRFRVADMLITNFHLPKSTLFMLVSAFSGLENVHRCYQEAISRRYRFFSYGDAMLFQ